MKYFLLILISFLFASCDCIYETTGTVMNEQGKPLDSVVYFVKERGPYDYTKPTDTLGKFDVHEITGFTCGCKDIVFARSGYDTITMKIDNMDTVVVKMKKVK